MSDLTARAPTDWKTDAMRKRIRRRYGAERRFRLIGLGAVLLSAAFLAFLLITMIGNGLGGFTQTEVKLKLDFQKSALFIITMILNLIALHVVRRYREQYE